VTDLRQRLVSAAETARHSQFGAPASICIEAADEIGRLKQRADDAEQRSKPSPEVADRMSPDIFTMVEDRGATFLMRGPICFGEVRAQESDQWRAWGYGLEAFIGTFPTFNDAARAVVKSAWETLETAGLTLTSQQRAAP